MRDHRTLGLHFCISSIIQRLLNLKGIEHMRQWDLRPTYLLHRPQWLCHFFRSMKDADLEPFACYFVADKRRGERPRGNLQQPNAEMLRVTNHHPKVDLRRLWFSMSNY